MFGLSAQKKTTTGVDSGPKKTAVVIESDPEFETKYDSLARELGVAHRVVTRRRELLTYLRDNEIEIYDLAKVEEYMDKKGRWAWFPLRAVDCREPSYRSWDLDRVTTTDYPSSFGSSKAEVYSKPVPYPVLCTVKTISDAFPGHELIFLVAAIDTHPDPFLGCRFRNDPDRTVIVIERWDEPSFRG